MSDEQKGAGLKYIFPTVGGSDVFVSHEDYAALEQSLRERDKTIAEFQHIVSVVREQRRILQEMTMKKVTDLQAENQKLRELVQRQRNAIGEIRSGWIIRQQLAEFDEAYGELIRIADALEKKEPK
jgi:hypothetical protein